MSGDTRYVLVMVNDHGSRCASVAVVQVFNGPKAREAAQAVADQRNASLSPDSTMKFVVVPEGGQVEL
jgi:hypothetical protein